VKEREQGNTKYREGEREREVQIYMYICT